MVFKFEKKKKEKEEIHIDEKISDFQNTNFEKLVENQNKKLITKKIN